MSDIKNVLHFYNRVVTSDVVVNGYFAAMVGHLMVIQGTFTLMPPQPERRSSRHTGKKCVCHSSIIIIKIIRHLMKHWPLATIIILCAKHFYADRKPKMCPQRIIIFHHIIGGNYALGHYTTYYQFTGDGAERWKCFYFTTAYFIHYIIFKKALLKAL